MKTITRSTYFSSGYNPILCWIVLWLSYISSAQVQNNGSVFVTNNAYMRVFSNDYNFGNTPAATFTTRTSVTYGLLAYSSGVTTSSASNSHYLDGYGRTYGTTQFIMPVGQSGVYAPIALTPSNTNGTDAAYYRASPTTIGSAVSSNLLAISVVEYWHVLGASNASVISLAWRATSDVTSLTSNLSWQIPNLVIAGWNGTQWVEIPSTVDGTSFLGGSSTMTAGSVTSNAAVNLTTYNYFTIGLKNSCAPLVSSSRTLKTWSGSWSPSAPTLSDPVEINSAFSGTLQCNSLVLNADITLANGEYVE